MTRPIEPGDMPAGYRPKRPHGILPRKARSQEYGLGENKPTLTRLSQPRQRLIRSVLDVNHGKIERQHVVNGEPVFEPPPIYVLTVKYDGDSGPHPCLKLDNFVLNKQFMWLIDLLGTRTMLIREIIIQDGVPLRASYEEPLKMYELA